jgi:transposase
LWHKRLAEIIDLAKNLDDPIQHHRLRHSAMAAYLKKLFTYNPLIARKPLIRVTYLCCMTEQSRTVVLNDDQWAVLGPLIDECRPRGKTEPVALRETIEAIVWRHQNGAKWRSVPPDLVPWWRAAQTFIRWSHLGVWERLLDRVQERGVELGMAFLDGTSIRAHHKAAGAPKKGDLEPSAMCVKRLAGLAAAMAPRPA